MAPTPRIRNCLKEYHPGGVGGWPPGLAPKAAVDYVIKLHALSDERVSGLPLLVGTRPHGPLDPTPGAPNVPPPFPVPAKRGSRE